SLIGPVSQTTSWPVGRFASHGGHMYRLSRRYSLRCAAVSGCLAMLASAAASGTQVSGWIRLSDENFAVDVHTTGSSLTLAARGCNNFDLSLVAPSPRSA